MLTMPVRTLAFVGSREQVKEMEREFPTLKLPMFASGHGADVVEKGNSKADGLRRLAVYFGEKEDLSDTVAFGDSMNDIEVVQEAGIGVAMGNAVDALKKVADYVTARSGKMEFIKRANTFIYFKEVIFLFYLFPFSYINDIIASK